MAPRLEPHEQFVDDTTLGAIFVSGEAGTQCGLQARWYLLRGYQVYNASTKKPLILRAVGWGADTKYNTYEVTYLAGYKPRTQEKPHSSTPFSLGNWKDVYTRQIKAIDHLIGELMRFGKQVTVRKWRWELNAIQVDKTQALQLEQKSELETLESAELTSREYLKNLPAAKEAIRTREGRKTAGERYMNEQHREDAVRRLVQYSEGQKPANGGKKSASDPR